MALSWTADYTTGLTPFTEDIKVVFVPAVFGGVTWTPSSQQLDVTGGFSSGVAPTGGSVAATGITNANFAAAFNVNLTASVVTGGGAVLTTGEVSVVYTYTPAPQLTLACPATTSGTVSTAYSSGLIAAGGVPPYGPYAIIGGSISPLTLNASTGVISGTLPSSPTTISFTAMVTDSAASTASTTATCVITVTPPVTPPGVCSASTPVFPTDGGAPAGSFLIRYAANLNIGDSFIDITNAGTTVDPTTGASSNLCVNVYTFDTQEELISCCACLVTPNGLQSISVQHSLINNPLTPAVPSAAVVKLVASVPGTGALAQGALAWGTTLHSNTSSPSTYGLTETPFLPSTLTRPELSHITSTCGFIQQDGTSFGICGGCNGGGLGSASSSQ